MFIGLVQPKVAPIYRTKDRTMLRVMETGAPGRLMLNLEFHNDEEAARFIEQLNFELKKERPKE